MIRRILFFSLGFFLSLALFGQSSGGIVSGGGGSAITVKESDGAPSVSPVSTIQLTGCTLVDNGAGDVTITCSGVIQGTVGIVDNIVPRSDGTGGFTLQGSLFSIGDTGIGTGLTGLTVGNLGIGNDGAQAVLYNIGQGTPTTGTRLNITTSNSTVSLSDSFYFFQQSGSRRIAINTGADNISLGSGVSIKFINHVDPEQGTASSGIKYGGSGIVDITDGASVVNLRVDTSAVAGNTRFFIYDVDNATLERVTVGDPDSCGTGFKCLRIPN